ncbi:MULTISPECIES: GNAT family N-acetyltransferase [Sphingobacterium]|uniref:GNAT family N-acetyltransferase n=1 Tax=Sphingobacterium TaxID=28453 RepID=UPI00104C04E9|nr:MULTISPECIES: GNAT family N-acetyltransferase [Sphingobacterium]MCW2258702.1 ribosomal protein S18 acetylase RimI-like enzyme [Sphingobacterium kitahiroshimense]TCR14842.1 ribosomal protein S18 acetylase RimI-like enzyme [Sphingobacterium sp. JUb78]
MEKINIKKVTLSDIKDLQKIGKQTFFETFSESNSEENMKKYLEEGFSVDKLTEELTNPYSEFYFALDNQEVIGYLKLNVGESQTEEQHHESLEIERIYVLQDYHGKKIGQILYEKALQIALERKSEYVWLGVWEENPRAISFYKKNGFIEFDKHIFVLGDDEQTDIMMKKML